MSDPLERAAFQQPAEGGSLTAGQAKRLGKKLVLRSDWFHVRLQIMEGLVQQKFQDRELGERLLATGNRQLVEGNEHGDTFWGRSRGKGFNHLGRILMKVRGELQQAKKYQEET